jgi:hypothetical protein
MNRITKTTAGSLVLCVLLLSSATESVLAFTTAGSDTKMSLTKRQNDITIACPTQVTYRIDANPQWEAGFHGIKRLTLEDATASGRILTCNYAAASGGVRDSSMLSREMPAGYICTSNRVYGAKTWAFTCKRAVAPIRIKPKAD